MCLASCGLQACEGEERSQNALLVAVAYADRVLKVASAFEWAGTGNDRVGLTHLHGAYPKTDGMASLRREMGFFD